MKKFVQTMVVAVVIVCAAVGIIAYKETDQVMAEDMGEKTETITVRNSTPFEISCVRATFDPEKSEETEKITPGEETTVAIPKDVQNVSSLKVEGTTRDGKTFANTFNGLITDDMVVMITLDEELNLNVSSNLAE